MNDVTVTLTKDQWAGVIRLMAEGQAEGCYYVGREAETDTLISAVCVQSGITKTEAEDMEPARDPYVPDVPPDDAAAAALGRVGA